MQITSGKLSNVDKYFLNSGHFLKIDRAFHCKTVNASVN